MKDSLIIYNSIEEVIECLEPEQVKSLMLAMIAYNKGEDVPELDAVTKMAFIPLRQQIDRDTEKYNDKCEKRANAGRKGAEITNSKRSAKVGNAENESAKTANAEFDENASAKTADTDTVYDTDTEYESDINKNTHTSSVDDVVSMYNKLCPSLPSVTILSDKRKQGIDTVLNKYTLGEIRKAFEKSENTPYLRGDGGGFRATLDWLIKDDNMAKVLDGNYDDRPNKQRAAPARAPAAANTRFNNFEQRNYDYSELERQLLSSERKDDGDEQTKSMGKPCG